MLHILLLVVAISSTSNENEASYLSRKTHKQRNQNKREYKFDERHGTPSDSKSTRKPVIYEPKQYVQPIKEDDSDQSDKNSGTDGNTRYYYYKCKEAAGEALDTSKKYIIQFLETGKSFANDIKGKLQQNKSEEESLENQDNHIETEKESANERAKNGNGNDYKAKTEAVYGTTKKYISKILDRSKSYVGDIKDKIAQDKEEKDDSFKDSRNSDKSAGRSKKSYEANAKVEDIKAKAEAAFDTSKKYLSKYLKKGKAYAKDIYEKQHQGKQEEQLNRKAEPNSNENDESSIDYKAKTEELYNITKEAITKFWKVGKKYAKRIYDRIPTTEEIKKEVIKLAKGMNESTTYYIQLTKEIFNETELYYNECRDSDCSSEIYSREEIEREAEFEEFFENSKNDRSDEENDNKCGRLHCIQYAIHKWIEKYVNYLVEQLNRNDQTPEEMKNLKKLCVTISSMLKYSFTKGPFQKIPHRIQMMDMINQIGKDEKIPIRLTINLLRELDEIMSSNDFFTFFDIYLFMDLLRFVF